MRAVADTGVVVSALLWRGFPHRLLAAAEAGHLALYSSPPLIEELVGVLRRPKFAARLQARRVTPEKLVAGYLRLARVVLPQPIAPVIADDPDDDAVLACAVAAQAPYIVSGDHHLLRVKRYRFIHLVSPRTFLVEVLRVTP